MPQEGEREHRYGFSYFVNGCSEFQRDGKGLEILAGNNSRGHSRRRSRDPSTSILFPYRLQSSGAAFLLLAEEFRLFEFDFWLAAVALWPPLVAAAEAATV